MAGFVGGALWDLVPKVDLAPLLLLVERAAPSHLGTPDHCLRGNDSCLTLLGPRQLIWASRGCRAVGLSASTVREDHLLPEGLRSAFDSDEAKRCFQVCPGGSGATAMYAALRLYDVR